MQKITVQSKLNHKKRLNHNESTTNDLPKKDCPHNKHSRSNIGFAMVPRDSTECFYFFSTTGGASIVN